MRSVVTVLSSLLHAFKSRRWSCQNRTPAGPRDATAPRSTAAAAMLLDDFVLLKKLGEGAFATVWAARRTRARPRPGARDDDHDDHDDHDDDGRTLFAVKHLKRKDAPGSSLNGGRSLLDSAEFRALRVLPRHANVLRAVQVARERGVVFLVTEWCDSNLLQLIDASRASGARALSEPVVARATRQLLSALAHCHARAWAHRDVKPENVLVKDGVAKLADFGEACEFASDDARTSYVGTRWYRAPEQFIVEHARRARRGGGGGGGGGGGARGGRRRGRDVAADPGRGGRVGRRMRHGGVRDRPRAVPRGQRPRHAEEDRRRGWRRRGRGRRRRRGLVRERARGVGGGGESQARSIHWFPYDRVGVVNADSLRTFAVASLRPPHAFNTRPRRLSTPSDAYELHPNIRLYGQLPSAPAARRREAPSGACARRREIVWARPRPAGSICFGSCCVRTRARGSPPRRR